MQYILLLDITCTLYIVLIRIFSLCHSEQRQSKTKKSPIVGQQGIQQNTLESCKYDTGNGET